MTIANWLSGWLRSWRTDAVLLADFLDDDLTEVARVQHRIVPYRAIVAVLCGFYAQAALGGVLALAWTLLTLCCELWTWFATRPATRGALTRAQTMRYVLSGIATVPAWTALGALYWFSSTPGAPAVALAMWGAQLIYTQRFIYQSRLSIVVGNSSTVTAMLVFPTLFPRFDQDLQGPLLGALLLGIAFAISGALMTLRNVDSLAREKQIVEYTAGHDGLTGLANRGIFQQRLRELLDRGAPCAVLFIDLDRFKQVNDLLGHQAGDLLLEHFAGRLRRATEGSVCVARFGGDEFAVLSETAVTAGLAACLAEAVIDIAGRDFELDGKIAKIGASVSVALAPEHGSDCGELMRKADLALYAAKEAGRSDFRTFSVELDRVINERIVLENA